MAADILRKRVSLHGLVVPMLLFGLFISSLIWAQPDSDASADSIDPDLITRLQVELTEAAAIESTSQRRRALKNVARDAQSLIEKHPESIDRFHAVGVVFLAQRQLLVMRSERRSQEELIETSRILAGAPDEFASVRLQADVLLLQFDLDRQGATEYERAVAIADLADRYRQTPAEVQSLILACELAFNLGEAELLSAFRYTLSTKFSDDQEASGFLRERFAYKSGSFLIRGRFKDASGQTLVLPIDRAGHTTLYCFWSHDTPGLKQRLMAIKALQEQYPGRFEVLTFNLDELPDAGKKSLEQWGLDWRPLHAPGGMDNELFRTFSSDPDFLIRMSNSMGYAIFTPIGSTYRTFGRVTDLQEYLVITMENERFHALIQAARIGEFLILDPFKAFDPLSPPELDDGSRRAGNTTPRVVQGDANDVPEDTLQSIQACFTAPPMRYRLSNDEARNNYERCVQLCDQAIKSHGEADNLWLVHNRRIIALLGMWNISSDAQYLQEAIKSAHAVLGNDLPHAAELVAKFCLTKAALRQEGADSKALISTFAQGTEGDEPSALVTGAALVLSMDAVSPEIYPQYRQALLDQHMGNPRLWSLTAFCFDKFVNGRLFRGNYYASEVRFRAGFRDWQKSTETRPRQFLMQFHDLKGNVVDFPHRDSEQSNAVVFLELPASEESAAVQVDLVSRIEVLANQHARKKLNFVIAFVSQDIEGVKALVRKNGWDAGRVALVSGGLSNPHVLRLGIFLTDERPNTFMVNHDGTIKWAFGGLYHLATSTNAVADTVMEMTQRHDLAVADLALQRGAFARALSLYESAYPPDKRKFPDLVNARTMGKAKANVRLGHNEDALQLISAVIDEHSEQSRLRACACDGLSAMLLARAEALEQLGNEDAAAADRLRAGRLACPPASDVGQQTSLYRSDPEIHRKFESFKLAKDWQGALDYIDDIIANSKDGQQASRNVLAGWLHERAQALSNLDQLEQAHQDRARAEALTASIKAPEVVAAQARDGRNPRRYVDIVNHAEN